MTTGPGVSATARSLPGTRSGCGGWRKFPDGNEPLIALVRELPRSEETLMRGVLVGCALMFVASIEAQTIYCESVDGKPRECRAGTSGVATLVSELSEGRCFEGTTWG